MSHACYPGGPLLALLARSGSRLNHADGIASMDLFDVYDRWVLPPRAEAND
jgi:hypothetical protein